MLDHRTVSLAEKVFERLENDILTGKYPRGTVLTEMMLVSDLGVSRTPIREALSRLEQERLISTTGKGITVLGVTAKGANLDEAIKKAYAAIGDVEFTDMHYRRDIGVK